MLISISSVTASNTDNSTVVSVNHDIQDQISSNVETKKVTDDLKEVSSKDKSVKTDISKNNNIKCENNIESTDKTIKSKSTTTTSNNTVETEDNSKVSTTKNNTTKINPNIRLNNQPLRPGTNTTFVAIVPADAKGNSVFKINGKTISNKININGSMVKYNYHVPTSFHSKTYNLTFVYSGDSKYLKKSVSTIVELDIESGKNPNMQLNNVTGKYLKVIPIKVKLASDATGNVVFKIKGTTISDKIKVVNGVATFYYNKTFVPGKYRLTAVYSGNAKYTNATVRSYLTITKLNSRIYTSNVMSKAGSKVSFKAQAVDELNRPINNSLVVFKLNGETFGRCYTNATGYAVYNYTLPSTLNSKSFIINVFSTENKRVYGAKKNATLYLHQLKTKVVVPVVNTKINDTVSLSATVIDENNNNVWKGEVTFKLNGKVLKTVNVSNGYALYSFKPTTNVATKFDIIALYTGYWKYASSFSGGRINVDKIGTITTTRAAETKTGSSVVLSAVVRDKNQQRVNGGYVEFKVNNTVVGKALVKNGDANFTYTLKLIPKGVYRLNATYLGSDSYYSSYNLNTLNVSQLSVRVVGNPYNVKVGESVVLKVNVLDETNHYVEKGVVEYKVNGTFIGRANVTKGVASLSYRPPNNFSGLSLKYSATLLANQYYNSTSTVQNLTISSLKNVYVSTKGNDNNLGDKAHPYKTLAYAVGHVSTFGCVTLLDGTYSASGILLNNSITIVGSSISKTIITGGDTYKPIFKLTSSITHVTIKFLTIKNGYSIEKNSAGAISSIGKLTIKGVNFVNNKATGLLSAGAIYSNGIMNLTTVKFINNTVKNINAEGGAVRLINNTTSMDNVEFNNNQAVGSNSTGGGAIYFKDGEMVIKNCKFNGNKATGKTILGGAIKSSFGNIVILSSSFTNNHVSGSNYALGGAISSLGTGLYINNTILQSNKATDTLFAGAGAIYSQYAAMILNNSVLKSNSAKSKSALGGAIEAYHTYATVQNTKISENYVEATQSSASGGAIYYESGNLTLDKCELASNTATSKNVSIGGALYISANVTVKDSDFLSNKATGKIVGGGAIANLNKLTVTKTNLISNKASDIGNAITATSNSHNSINGNYWGGSTPKWSTLLRGLSKPSYISKTKISH